MKYIAWIIIAYFVFMCVLVLSSCSTKENLVIKEAFIVRDKVMLLTKNDVIEVVLKDEVSNYLFKYNGDYHKFTYVCAGYSYGLHHQGDYIIYLGQKIPVIDDNGEITMRR